MSADIIRRLIEAGTPADIIADVAMELAAAQAASRAIEGRRSADRDRKAAQRSRESGEVTGSHVTARDSEDNSPLPPNGPPKEISNPPLNPPIPQQSIEQRVRAAKFKSRLDPAWRPAPLTGNAAAAVARWTPGEVDREFERFQNHWAQSAGPNAKKLDWQAAWSNWVLTAEDHQPKRARSSGSGRAGSLQAPSAPLVDLGDDGDGYRRAIPESLRRAELQDCEIRIENGKILHLVPSDWHAYQLKSVHNMILDDAARKAGLDPSMIEVRIDRTIKVRERAAA